MTKPWRIAFVLIWTIFAVLIFEPTGPVRCEAVQIVGLKTETKSTRFVVQGIDNNGTLRLWEPGAYSGPFETDYRGPAVLVLRLGKWTKREHLKVAESCPNDS